MVIFARNKKDLEELLENVVEADKTGLRTNQDKIKYMKVDQNCSCCRSKKVRTGGEWKTPST